MMRLARLLVAASIAAVAAPAHARQSTAPLQPETTQTPGQAPAPASTSPTSAQAPGAPASTTPATPAGSTLPPATTRTFTAPVGMWFLTVRPDRAADFEQVVARLQAALAKATDPRTREQAKSWRMLKAAEPGPNANVLYVFLIDATVPGADYGLGGILASAYTDTTELAEIWRMYTGAITGGGSLLNLTPIAPEIAPLGTKTTPIRVAPSASPAAPPAPTTEPAPTTSTTPAVPAPTPTPPADPGK